jgi:serine/threonine-protein kinase
LRAVERIDEACLRFEKAWQRGPAPLLSDFLGLVPEPERDVLLKELLRLDLHYRRKAGEEPTPEDYRQRLPRCERQLGRLFAELGAGSEWPRIPGYEILDELNRGGMGVVYRGRDPDLNRSLAIKVLLHEHKDDSELQWRFLEEAQIMGQLQHPGVAPIHEIGRLDDGRPFFSMKQVKGQTLAALLKGREQAQGSGAGTASDVPDRLPRILGVFEQLCQTVAYAHACGVIHRDLKPDNVMVGEFGEVQVMDWGLAKVLPRGGAEEQRPPWEEPGVIQTTRGKGSGVDSTAGSNLDTVAGRMMGTLPYMSPEQARGEVDALDQRCDVFGLGAILCQVLTGRPPYESRDPHEVYQQARNGDLTDAWRRLDGCGADTDLIGLARRCLQPVKEDRPRQAGEVAQAVRDYLASVQQRLRQAELARARAQVKAAEEQKRRLLERQKRRVQRALAGALVVFVLAAAGAGIWYYQDQAARVETEADLKTKLAREQTEKAKAEAESKSEEAIQEARRAQRKDQLEKTLAKEFAGIGRQRGDLLRKLGDAREASRLLSDIDQWRALVGQRRENWKRAAFLVRDGRGLLDDVWATQLKKLGEQLTADEKDWAWAKKLDRIREEAGTLVEGKFEPWTVKQKYAAVCQEMKLDVTKGDLGQLAEQVKASPLRYALVAALDDWASTVREGNSLLARLLELSRGADPDSWRDQVRDAKNWGDVQKLKDLAARAKVEGQTPQILLLLAYKLGVHNKAEGVNLLRQGLLHYPMDFWLHYDLGTLAADPVEQMGCFTAALAVRPDSASAHLNLGRALKAKGDLGGAIQHYHKAIDLDQNYALAYNNLGVTLKAKGDLGGAIQHFQKAITIAPDLSLAHNNLGAALYDKFGTDRAIGHFRKAIEIDPKNADAHFNLGNVLTNINDLDGAVTHYRKALVLNPNDAEALCTLGQALRSQGKFAEALQSLNQGHELGSKQKGFKPYYAQWKAQCEAKLKAVDQKLAAVVARQERPADVAEKLEFADLCLLHKKQFGKAERFYRDAFADDAKLTSKYQFKAACAAALAAAGKGLDAAKLDANKKGELRPQALAWLKAELAVLGQELKGDPKEAFFVEKKLQHWQTDPDLASVRDEKELAKLLKAERKEWQSFWAEVAQQEKKAGQLLTPLP